MVEKRQSLLKRVNFNDSRTAAPYSPVKSGAPKAGQWRVSGVPSAQPALVR